MSNGQSGELFQAWDLYESIIHYNWMCHVELGAFLAEVAAKVSQSKANRGEGGLRVLDLGCGDGAMAARGLSNCSVDRYVGVDLSQDALSKLMLREGLGKDRKVVCGDIRESVRDFEGGAFDLVISSFSLHHFSMAEKQTILGSISRSLSPFGRFVWIDVYRGEGEEREGYIGRISEEIHNHWQQMPIVNREASVEHIRECDFPESQSWMLEAWAATGAQNATAEHGFRNAFYGSWAF
jgi:ubiquinone/menaquinone biosynthesis C-methylase UbiE